MEDMKQPSSTLFGLVTANNLGFGSAVAGMYTNCPTDLALHNPGLGISIGALVAEQQAFSQIGTVGSEPKHCKTFPLDGWHCISAPSCPFDTILST
jgi:hypothetical protein